MPHKPQWTSGPWRAEMMAHDIEVLTLPSSVSAMAQALEYPSNVIARLPSVRPAAEVWRNARLIAAAPELYEALQSLIEHYRPFPWEKALKAVAKARGEQSDPYRTLHTPDRRPSDPGANFPTHTFTPDEHYMGIPRLCVHCGGTAAHLIHKVGGESPDATK